MSYDDYDGNPEHDMWVDFTTYQYTGEPADDFGAERPERPEPGAPRRGGVKASQPRALTAREAVEEDKKQLERLCRRLMASEKKLKSAELTPEEREELEHLVNELLPYDISAVRAELAKDEAALLTAARELYAKKIGEQRAKTVTTAAVCIAAVLFTVAVMAAIYVR